MRIASIAQYGGLRMREGSDIPPGLVPGDLNLVGWAEPNAMATLLDGRVASTQAKVWRSATPYLINRQGKRNQSAESLALEDLRRELAFRFEVPPQITSVALESGPPESGPVDARRYRQRTWRRHPRRNTRTFPAVWLRVEFEAPVEAPLLSLGAKNHFGFGRLTPVD